MLKLINTALEESLSDMGDLNTSHVKVNLGGFATWDEFLQAFKYISC